MGHLGTRAIDLAATPREATAPWSPPDRPRVVESVSASAGSLAWAGSRGGESVVRPCRLRARAS